MLIGCCIPSHWMKPYALLGMTALSDSSSSGEVASCGRDFCSAIGAWTCSPQYRGFRFGVLALAFTNVPLMGQLALQPYYLEDYTPVGDQFESFIAAVGGSSMLVTALVMMPFGSLVDKIR